jgi:hypothetical protein
MALDTYAALKTSVLSWLARPGDPLVEPAVGDMVRLFEAEASRRLKVGAAEKAVSIAMTDTATAALPSDCCQIRRVTMGEALLAYVPPHQLAAQSGVPRAYTLFGATQIWLGPAPQGAYTVDVIYQSGVPPLSDANPSNWLLTAHPDAYLFGVLSEAELYIGHDERAPLWLQRREAAFASIEQASYKARVGDQLQIRVDGITTVTSQAAPASAAPGMVGLPGTGGGFITVGETPPINPRAGDGWFDSVGAQLYVWFIDASGSAAWVPATNTSGTAVSNIRTEAPFSGAVIVMSAADQALAVTSSALAALTIHLPPGPGTGQEVELWFAAPVAALSLRDSAGAAITSAPDSAYGPGAALVMRWTGSVWVYWK